MNIKGWRPENYTREYFGEVRMQQALAMSLNTPVVRLIQEMGPRAAVRTAQRLGVSSPLQAVPSLALGTSDVTPMELTAAYAASRTAARPSSPMRLRRCGRTAGKSSTRGRTEISAAP